MNNVLYFQNMEPFILKAWVVYESNQQLSVCFYFPYRYNSVFWSNYRKLLPEDFPLLMSNWTVESPELRISMERLPIADCWNYRKNTSKRVRQRNSWEYEISFSAIWGTFSAIHLKNGDNECSKEAVTEGLDSFRDYLETIGNLSYDPFNDLAGCDKKKCKLYLRLRCEQWCVWRWFIHLHPCDFRPRRSAVHHWHIALRTHTVW